MSQASRKLTVRYIPLTNANGGFVKFFLDGVNIASLDSGTENKKSIEIEQGEHKIHAQMVMKAVNLVTQQSNVVTFSVSSEDVSIIITFKPNEIRCTLDYPSMDIASLEVEKESLERTIANSGMKIGMLFTYIFLIFLFACLGWYFGYFVFDQDAIGICILPILMGVIGALITLVVQFKKSNNNTFLERRSRELNLEIAKRKGSNNADSKSPKTMKDNESGKIKDALPSITQDLETELRKIKKLLDDELISEEEFKELRKKIIEKQK